MTKDQELELQNISWLSNEDYQKAVGQFRIKVSALLTDAFDMYGLGHEINPITKEIVSLAEDFGLRVRGLDHPINTPETQRRERRNNHDG